MKFRHCYFVHNRVNMLDTFLSSFLTLLILMGIIIYLVGVQFTYNSIYLVIIIALAFSLSMVWVHSFRRRASL